MTLAAGFIRGSTIVNLYDYACRLATAESDERGQEVDTSEKEVRFQL